jgi:hypothetical protein
MAGRRADLDAANHSGDLVDAFRRRESANPCSGSTARFALVDDEVRIPESRNLGQVSNAHDLPVVSDVADGAPDNLGDRTADPSVDFIEYVRPGGALVGQHSLERKERARELASARDATQGSRLLASVGRNEEFHVVDARARETRALDGERGVGRSRRRGNFDDDSRPAHAELRELSADRGSQGLGRLTPLSRKGTRR